MKARRVKGLDPDGALADNAQRMVAVRLDELRALAAKALDPARVKALHDTRIAAKRLRYVLEICAPALGASARDGARTAKRLQDLLGEIHDCDVMLPRVQAHIDRLRAEDAEFVRRAAGARAKDLSPSAARGAPNRARYRGLEALTVYLSARRTVLFGRFLEDWEALEDAGFATGLIEGLSPQRPGPAAPSGAGEP